MRNKGKKIGRLTCINICLFYDNGISQKLIILTITPSSDYLEIYKLIDLVLFCCASSLKEPKMKSVKLLNSLDPDEAAHNELSHRVFCYCDLRRRL